MPEHPQRAQLQTISPTKTPFPNLMNNYVLRCRLNPKTFRLALAIGFVILGAGLIVLCAPVTLIMRRAARTATSQAEPTLSD